jgi:glycerophosphoryl diester phosphodiesterase
MPIPDQPPLFELQGHRGARGLKPENTLPAFEVAFDLGVTSVETDVHLTADHIPILFHDHNVSDRICRPVRGTDGIAPCQNPKISSLTLSQMRQYCADLNPDPNRFPHQENKTTPLAVWFSQRQGIDVFTPPMLADLLAFAIAYAGEPGRMVGKTGKQQARARGIRFDLELKRVPFRPGIIEDAFDGRTPSILEQRVIEIVREANMTERVRFRSFDHRCVRFLGELAPEVPRAILVAETAPVAPSDLIRQADTTIYCPHVEFLDELQVEQIHREGFQVIPWTVNDPEDWQKLLDWGVDGITTDFPDRLAELLSARKIAY